MNDYDKNFLYTFNECYPFERYIIKEPKSIGNLFDDAVLTEIFVPYTEIKPILDDNGRLISFTGINKDEVYVKLRTILIEVLNTQKALIKEKYGECHIKTSLRDNLVNE